MVLDPIGRPIWCHSWKLDEYLHLRNGTTASSLCGMTLTAMSIEYEHPTLKKCNGCVWHWQRRYVDDLVGITDERKT